MEDILKEFENSASSAVNTLKEELKGIRTGRANPGMIENMIVETYGGTTKLKLLEIASINNEGNTALVVTPFDPSTSKDIEKAIMTSPIGINPQIDGHKIILRIPPLSEEQRVKYTKLVSQMTEDFKNKIRYFRDDARKKLSRSFDNKELTEDEKFRNEKTIDTRTTSLNLELQSIREAKEVEIMTV